VIECLCEREREAEAEGGRERERCIFKHAFNISFLLTLSFSIQVHDDSYSLTKARFAVACER
jgi:hypothetical protein